MTNTIYNMYKRYMYTKYDCGFITNRHSEYTFSNFRQKETDRIGNRLTKGFDNIVTVSKILHKYDLRAVATRVLQYIDNDGNLRREYVIRTVNSSEKVIDIVICNAVISVCNDQVKGIHRDDDRLSTFYNLPELIKELNEYADMEKER